ncbi:MAG: manganese transporter, partial [Acidimicrobiales bacterium]
AVLGPWTNSTGLNIFTAAAIWKLITLSLVLTASVIFPTLSSSAIVRILGSGTDVGVVGGGAILALGKRKASPSRQPSEAISRATWRMPALELLERPRISTFQRASLLIVRGYLAIAVGIVVVKVAQVAAGH